MKHKWLIAVFSAVFILALALGIGIRLLILKDDSGHDLNVSLPTDATSSPIIDPNIPQYTVSPPSTEPVMSDLGVSCGGFDNFETIFPDEPNAEPILSTNTSSDGDGIVHICIGGDTSIDGEFADFASSRSPDYPWEDISGIMSGADIAIVNLETCVSEQGASEKREGYGFETPPKMLEGFKNAGIDAVNLANNHVRDFGYDALLDTFSNLFDYGIKYFGAGRDYDEAGDLLIFERDGVKIGFTGANKVYLSQDCVADEEHAGVNQIGEIGDESTERFAERLSEYDTLCDVLIVFIHAGTEEVYDVTSYQKDISRLCIDAGADIIVGGHSHTLQPIEFYKGKPIIYSIGNLIFWHIDDDLDGLAAIFDISVSKSGFIGLTLRPVFIKNYKANILSEGEGKFPTRYRQIIDLMNTNCEPYGISFDDSGKMQIIDS